MTANVDERPIASSLRRTARRFATGVTVVAVRRGAETYGLTANSFLTLSLEPPLIGVSVTARGRMRRLTEPGGHFGVSILCGHQHEYAQHFAAHARAGLPPHLPPLITDGTPAPLVPGCAAYFVCRIEHIYPVGDHDLIVGEVIECDAPNLEEPPLIFLDGGYRTAGDEVSDD
ncbi:flavin reductase family protein [Micromonospora sp. NBC_01405]|uniref:flavin reductase family protein n=1 Tax=Micromonospora sp. NBC_01405 TaxID=2903589 RepID=UPI00324633B3